MDAGALEIGGADAELVERRQARTAQALELVEKRRRAPTAIPREAALPIVRRESFVGGVGHHDPCAWDPVRDLAVSDVAQDFERAPRAGCLAIGNRVSR